MVTHTYNRASKRLRGAGGRVLTLLVPDPTGFLSNPRLRKREKTRDISLDWQFLTSSSAAKSVGRMKNLTWLSRKPGHDTDT